MPKAQFLPWTTCPSPPFALCTKIALPVACTAPFSFRESAASPSPSSFVDLLTDAETSEAFIWGFCGEILRGRFLWRMMFFSAPGSLEDAFWWIGWFLWDAEWCFTGLRRCAVDFQYSEEKWLILDKKKLSLACSYLSKTVVGLAWPDQIIFAFSLMFDVEESSFPKMGYCKLRLTSPRRTQLLKDF